MKSSAASRGWASLIVEIDAREMSEPVARHLVKDLQALPEDALVKIVVGDGDIATYLAMSLPCSLWLDVESWPRVLGSGPVACLGQRSRNSVFGSQRQLDAIQLSIEIYLTR